MSNDFDELFQRALAAAGVRKHPIITASGMIKGRSHNLRGILEAVSKQSVDYIEIVPAPKGEGIFRVKFSDGSKFQTVFASYHVLQEWLASRRRFEGIPLKVDGQSVGDISKRNPALM